MKTLNSHTHALAAISFKFTEINRFTLRQKVLLHDYVSLPDGLMKQLIDQTDGPDSQHVCLAYAPRPIILQEARNSWEEESPKKTRSRIVGWSMLRQIQPGLNYHSFHPIAPVGVFEMMAFVIPELRERGIAKATCAQILRSHKVPFDRRINVFTSHMEGIMHSLGYKQTIVAPLY